MKKCREILKITLVKVGEKDMSIKEVTFFKKKEKKFMTSHRLKCRKKNVTNLN